MQRNAIVKAGLLKGSLLAFMLTSSAAMNAQDDLLALAGDSANSSHEKVFATFKTVKLINAQTIETAKQGTLDFYITHRFGNMGAASNGGGHTLWGFDESQDIRFSFDYGITEKLAIGIGRSKMNELLDGNIKWRFMEQTDDNHVPFSAAFYGSTGLTTYKKAIIYAGLDSSLYSESFAHRMNYVSQLILARKFNWRFSMEILPTYVYRNFVVSKTNPDKPDAADVNGFFSVGAGFRFKFTKRFSMIADYYYNFSDYRRGNPDYKDPLGIGFELETGGHVFHFDLTNSSGIIANNYLPNTRDNWLKGGYKLGFSISRAFGLRKSH